MLMYECGKHKGCNAPVCPLDPGMKQCRYLEGEAICFYMLEFMKPNSKKRLKDAIGNKHYRAVSRAVIYAKERHSGIKRRLEQASRTNSRLKGE